MSYFFSFVIISLETFSFTCQLHFMFLNIFIVLFFQSLNHTNGGHSSYVTRVEFLADDSRLISTGGRDTAIMQWNLS